jgi:nicotinamidase-related amidase
MFVKKDQVFRSIILTAIGAFTAMPALAQAPAAGTVTLPEIPAPVAVTVDAKSSALLILDISTAICKPNPACMATVPAIVALAKKARDAKVPVIYSSTANPAGPPPMVDEVKPQAGEPTVATRADKFIDTNLAELLKQHNAKTLVIVGSAANGAVLYTSFHANYLGFTVVVAEDGISSGQPFSNFVARYQLLNEPGFANATNKPLAEKQVTLSKGDLITFK